MTIRRTAIEDLATRYSILKEHLDNHPDYKVVLWTGLTLVETSRHGYEVLERREAMLRGNIEILRQMYTRDYVNDIKDVIEYTALHTLRMLEDIEEAKSLIGRYLDANGSDQLSLL